MFDMGASDTTVISNFWQQEPQVSEHGAPPLADYLANYIFEGFKVVPSLLFEQQQLQIELDELASLPDNWNGEGGVQISPSVVARTRLTISSIASDIPGPELTPNSNGTISLEWEYGSRFLHLEIGEEDFSILVGGEGKQPMGAQGKGLPNKGLLANLIAAISSLDNSTDTSITAEKIAA